MTWAILWPWAISHISQARLYFHIIEIKINVVNHLNLTAIVLSLRIWCIILPLEIWQPHTNVSKNVQRKKRRKKERTYSDKELSHKNALSVLEGGGRDPPCSSTLNQLTGSITITLTGIYATCWHLLHFWDHVFMWMTYTWTIDPAKQMKKPNKKKTIFLQVRMQLLFCLAKRC